MMTQALTPAALSNVVLLDPPWLLGGESKEASGRGCHLWSEILRVTESKQQLFIERALMVHEVAVRRAGKSLSNVRLQLAEWNAEVDRMCCVAYILEEMSRLHDEDGELLFQKDTLESIRNRALEGYLGSKSKVFPVPASAVFNKTPFGVLSMCSCYCAVLHLA